MNASISTTDNFLVNRESGFMNSTNNFNFTTTKPPTNLLFYGLTLTFVLATVAGIMSIVTITGNVVVLLSFILERSIRQPSNYFIASLAVSDLLIGAISIPFYAAYLLAGQRWMIGEFLCDLWLSIDYSACLCSIYTVFCITVDRFCSVKIPAKYRAWRTGKKVLIIIIVIWTIPVVVFFTSIFGWQYFTGKRDLKEGECEVQYMKNAVFNSLLQIGYFWVTIIIMIGLYAGIYMVVLGLQKKSEEKRKKIARLVATASRTKSQMQPLLRKVTNENILEANNVKEQVKPTDEADKNISTDNDQPNLNDPNLITMGSLEESDKVCQNKGQYDMTSTSSNDADNTTNQNIFESQILNRVDELDEHSKISPKPHFPNLNLNSDKVTPRNGTKYRLKQRRWSKSNKLGRPFATSPGVETALPFGKSDTAETNLSGLCTTPSTAPTCSLCDAGEKICCNIHSKNEKTLKNLFNKRKDKTGEAIDRKTCKQISVTTEDDSDIECQQNVKTDQRVTNSFSESKLKPVYQICSFDETNPENLVNQAANSDSVDDGNQEDDYGSDDNSRDKNENFFRNCCRVMTNRVNSKKKFSLKLRAQDANDYNEKVDGKNLQFTHGDFSKSHPAPKQPSRREDRAFKALRTITIILGAFILCWTPWHVFALIMGFCPTCINQYLYSISYWACYTNSPINPFCYAFANQQFKKTFVRIFKLDWKRT